MVPPAVTAVINVSVPTSAGVTTATSTPPTPELGVELGELELIQLLELLSILWTSVLPLVPETFTWPATKKNCVPAANVDCRVKAIPSFTCDAVLRSSDWPRWITPYTVAGRLAGVPHGERAVEERWG
jgi:hypothetical protein